MIRATILFLAAWLMCFGANAESQQVLLEPGQVWTVKDSPVPETRVTICLVEAQTAGEFVVHVSLVGVGLGRLPNGGLFGGTIMHLPFERGAFAASLDALVEERQVPRPECHMSIRNWKATSGRPYETGVAEAITKTLELNQITPMTRN